MSVWKVFDRLVMAVALNQLENALLKYARRLLCMNFIQSLKEKARLKVIKSEQGVGCLYFSWTFD